MVKAITQRDPDAPRPQAKRRRAGGTESHAPLYQTRALPRRIAARGRYAALRSTKAVVPALRHSFTDAADDAATQIYADTGLYLADTCAWLQAWENNADYVQIHDVQFSAIQDQYFPQP